MTDSKAEDRKQNAIKMILSNSELARFVGGGIAVIFDQTGNSAFVACENCGTKSRYMYLATKGQKGIVDSLASQWNNTIYDEPFRALKKSEAELTKRNNFLNKLTLTEAQLMNESYKRLLDFNMNTKKGKEKIEKYQDLMIQ